jgi:hypothetical protein
MTSKQNQHSHLFLVRLWSEETGDHNGWRGRVNHVLSGEARSFHDLPALIDLLLEMADTEPTQEIRGREREIEAGAQGATKRDVTP